MDEESGYTKEFGSRLRGLRAGKGISRGALARATGLSESTVEKLERGKTEPKLATVQKLARALGVELGELAG